MLKQSHLNTCLLVLGLSLASCESGVGSGESRPDIVVPNVNSTFIYDYEQRMIPVKPEDRDTTYKFELTARVDKQQLRENGTAEFISVELKDAEGFPMPNLRYKLSLDDEGNVYYNEPYFSNAWTKMAFATQESLTGPDTSYGNPSDYHQEVHQSTRYLGTEVLYIEGVAEHCEKIEWTRSLREVDQYSPKMGTQEERHVLWFATRLGFFAARESEVFVDRLHKPKWKYTTKERLKRYTISF